MLIRYALHGGDSAKSIWLHRWLHACSSTHSFRLRHLRHACGFAHSFRLRHLRHACGLTHSVRLRHLLHTCGSAHSFWLGHLRHACSSAHCFGLHRRHLHLLLLLAWLLLQRSFLLRWHFEWLAHRCCLIHLLASWGKDRLASHSVMRHLGPLALWLSLSDLLLVGSRHLLLLLFRLAVLLF